ncbi:MAG: histidine--tRNA ligase [Acidobacteria bacterium]|nr:histidine--tRNA ligase [Acidobacteriota bacterium]
MSGFTTSPGTRDILPPDAGRWRAFQDVFGEVAASHGYRYLIPPMFEDLGVFLRLGEATDVVTKEMYDFEDKGGRRVALRPEQTASVCRAFAQHRPVPPWKVWYAGPNFRYEKPQQGRYRQFDQVGVELLGPCDPDADAEVIALAWGFYRRLGLQQIALSVNTLGDEGDLQRYTAVLQAYLAERLDELSEESRATLSRNPLRVLDSKRPADAAVVAGAPRIVDHVGDGARAHFDRVLATLGEIGIPYAVEDRLVRGLDYYRHTTFEFVSTALDAAHVAVGGGGRYDGLVEALGGPPTPGVGFALGLDRTLLACDAEGCFPAPDPSVDVFVVDTTGGREAALVADELRRAGRSADRAYEQRSMKSQMKIADRSGARVAVIVGTDELASGTIVVRSMKSGEQRTVARSEMVGAVAAFLGGAA